MSVVQWIISKAVKHAIMEIALSIGRPTGYDPAVSAIRRRRLIGPGILDPDFHLLDRDAEVCISSDIIDKIIRLTRLRSFENLQNHLDDASDRLVDAHLGLLNRVVDGSPRSERASFQRHRDRLPEGEAEIRRMFSAEWKRTIYGLIKQKIEFDIEPEPIDFSHPRGFAVSHITDIQSAKAIVTERFLIPVTQQNPNANNEPEQRANFYEGYVTGGQSAREGCILYFQWFGPVADRLFGQHEGVKPSILYRRESWICTLMPTRENDLTHELVFTHAHFDAPIGEGDAASIMTIINRQNAPISMVWGR